MGEYIEGKVGQLTGNDYAEGAAGVDGEVVEGLIEAGAEVLEFGSEVVGSIIENTGEGFQHINRGDIGRGFGSIGGAAVGATWEVGEGAFEVVYELGEMVGEVGREAVEGVADVVENWF